MKVKDLINKLLRFKMDAEVEITNIRWTNKSHERNYLYYKISDIFGQDNSVCFNVSEIVGKKIKTKSKKIKVWSKTKKKELKKIMWNWEMFKQKDPLQDKAGLIRALSLVHRRSKNQRIKRLKQFYYNYLNTNKGEQ